MKKMVDIALTITKNDRADFYDALHDVLILEQELGHIVFDVKYSISRSKTCLSSCDHDCDFCSNVIYSALILVKKEIAISGDM